MWDGGLYGNQKSQPCPRHQELVQNDNVIQSAQGPTGYNRSCWPDNCGPGRGPWQDRQTALPPGVTVRRFQAGLDVSTGSTKNCSNFGPSWRRVQKYPLCFCLVCGGKRFEILTVYFFSLHQTLPNGDFDPKVSFKIIEKNGARNMWSSHTCSLMAQMMLAKMPSVWPFNDGTPTLAWHWWNRPLQTSQDHISRSSWQGRFG